jgi:hypothetical protein
MPKAPESFLRVAALHRQLSRPSTNETYYLSCRDSAKAFPGLSYQTASNINLALAHLGVVEVLCRGDARLSGGRASQSRYLLPETHNGGSDAEEEEELES